MLLSGIGVQVIWLDGDSLAGNPILLELAPCEFRHSDVPINRVSPSTREPMGGHHAGYGCRRQGFISIAFVHNARPRYQFTQARFTDLPVTIQSRRRAQ